MTIYVPPEARSLLTGTPICGSADDLSPVVTFVESVARDCSQYASKVRGAERALASEHSQGVSKIRGKLNGRLVPGSVRLSLSAQGAKGAFGVYASSVDRINGNARNVSRSVGDALVTIRTQASQIEEIASVIGVSAPYSWDSGAPGLMPEPRLSQRARTLDADQQSLTLRQLREANQARWALAASAWQTAIAEIAAARSRWESLIEERRSAEYALTGALETTVIGQLLSASDASPESPSFAIAAGVVGELWGERTNAPGLEQLPTLLSGNLPPEAVARVWQQLQGEGIDTEALLNEYSFELAALNGLPFAARDTAGQAALEYALDTKRPERLSEAFTRMGFESGERSLKDFRKDLESVRSALRDGREVVRSKGTVQLVEFGRHNGAVTAGISIGDLDTAASVGVFVSGMESNVRGMADALGAFGVISDSGTDMALVTWIGYRAPTLLEEPFQFRADEGAPELAAFLDGIAVRRSDNPMERFAVLGHSYGTNVGAEALKISGAGVDTFVTIGSAGLKYGTTAADLGSIEIYATHASGDNIAQTFGRYLHFRDLSDGGGLYAARVDPRDLPGANIFTSEQTEEGKAVTMHNLLKPMGWGPEWNRAQWLADNLDGIAAADEVGYLDPDASTVQEVKKIMRGQWK